MEFSGIQENKNYKYIIYEIKCKDQNIKENYIGSTLDFLKRKSVHKCKCKNDTYQNSLYSFIRENGGWDNFTMYPIEIYYCNEKIEALIREKYWINNINSTLNTLNSDINIPCNTRYYKNKDNILNKQKEYYLLNRDKILERCKKTYKYKKLKEEDNINIDNIILETV